MIENVKYEFLLKKKDDTLEIKDLSIDGKLKKSFKLTKI